MDSWKLKRLLRSSLGRVRMYHYFRYLINRKDINTYFTKYGQSICPQKLSLIKDAYINYHWNFDEFFLYDFASLNEHEKLSYVPEYEKNIFCDKANDNKMDLIFHDKWKTYIKFKDFYNRDAFLCREEIDLKSSGFIAFIEKNKNFIMKPVYAATGRGIEIIKCNDYNDAVKQLQTKLNDREPYILEELIVQSDSLAAFHPTSVNTIRISTFRYAASDIEILHPFIKFGIGGNFVDNAGCGGIIGKIDQDSGTIIAAIDESPKHYSHHPDTGKQIIGFKIPYWEEAVSLAKKLANMLPDVRYVGWDLALTENGWVMVEGNEKGMFIGFQLPTHTGFRPHFNLICKKANIKM